LETITNHEVDFMNNDLSKILAELAAKLGVSGEHLYGALLRQALFAGVWDVATGLLMLAAIWAGVLIWFRIKGKLNPGWSADWTTSGGVLVVAVLVSAIASDGLYYGISYLCNPDFYALRHLGIVDR
jgi:drug/metabolite transporter (DMT)-like permease